MVEPGFLLGLATLALFTVWLLTFLPEALTQHFVLARQDLALRRVRRYALLAVVALLLAFIVEFARTGGGQDDIVLKLTGYPGAMLLVAAPFTLVLDAYLYDRSQMRFGFFVLLIAMPFYVAMFCNAASISLLGQRYITTSDTETSEARLLYSSYFDDRPEEAGALCPINPVRVVQPSPIVAPGEWNAEEAKLWSYWLDRSLNAVSVGFWDAFDCSVAGVHRVRQSIILSAVQWMCELFMDLIVLGLLFSILGRFRSAPDEP